MKSIFVAVLATIALSACGTFGAVTANRGSVSYTCVPNEAMNRGPAVPRPAPGEVLVVEKSLAPDFSK